jgi:peptide-methionine (S)-S-oxide reductase
LESITLGGGCFWCLEAVYQLVDGVKSVVSGYSGGFKENPTYREVCNETTGHAEVIQIQFDPTKLSVEKILDIFWVIHDPTTLNQQGNDIGTQYRSVIYYHSEEQKKIALASISKAQENFKNPITTEVKAIDKFYKAEDYHQNYYNDNPNVPYCAYVVRSKVDKYIKKFGVS